MVEKAVEAIGKMNPGEIISHAQLAGILGLEVNTVAYRQTAYKVRLTLFRHEPPVSLDPIIDIGFRIEKKGEGGD